MASEILQDNKWINRAESAGLVYVQEYDKGYTRRRCGKGFTYLGLDGKTVKSRAIRERIRSLVIPPAWTDVWICPHPNGHIQATGMDAAGRKQYIYHPQWHDISSAEKFERLQAMAEMLPRIRRHVRKDLGEQALTKRRVIAAIVRLVDRIHIRIGHERYLQANKSRGATTLATENVDLDDTTVTLSYEGKSRKRHDLVCSDKKLADVIAECGEIESDYLFCYEDDDANCVSISASDVNEYLVDATDGAITTKDFRTWKGSVIALAALADMPDDASKSSRKRAIVQAVRITAEILGNTEAVCRQSYIHPGLLTAAEKGKLRKLLQKVESEAKQPAEFTKDEALLKALLPQLQRDTSGQP